MKKVYGTISPIVYSSHIYIHTHKHTLSITLHLEFKENMCTELRYITQIYSHIYMPALSKIFHLEKCVPTYGTISKFIHFSHTYTFNEVSLRIWQEKIYRVTVQYHNSSFHP